MDGEHFRFLDLPAELRSKIYDYICPEPLNGPDVFDTTQALRLVKQPLLQTNHCFRADVLHHQYSSRVTTIFINSPCKVGLDFLLAEAAYAAITRIELRIFSSLEQYGDNGEQRVILSDYQQKQLEAAFSFTDKTESLKSITLSCFVLPGIMQFPRRPELYKLFQDTQSLTKLQPFAVRLKWIPASATRVYPDPHELARATAECEAALSIRLPNFVSLGVQCQETCCAPKVAIRRMQTSSTFGRRAQSQQHTNGMF